MRQPATRPNPVLRSEVANVARDQEWRSYLILVAPVLLGGLIGAFLGGSAAAAIGLLLGMLLSALITLVLDLRGAR